MDTSRETSQSAPGRTSDAGRIDFKAAEYVASHPPANEGALDAGRIDFEATEAR